MSKRNDNEWVNRVMPIIFGLMAVLALYILFKPSPSPESILTEKINDSLYSQSETDHDQENSFSRMEKEFTTKDELSKEDLRIDKEIEKLTNEQENEVHSDRSLPVLPAIPIIKDSDIDALIVGGGDDPFEIKKHDERILIISNAKIALAHCHKGEVSIYATVLDRACESVEPEEVLPNLTIVEVKKYLGKEALKECRAGNIDLWFEKLVDACRYCPVDKIDSELSAREIKEFAIVTIDQFEIAEADVVDSGVIDIPIEPEDLLQENLEPASEEEVFDNKKPDDTNEIEEEPMEDFIWPFTPNKDGLDDILEYAF